MAFILSASIKVTSTTTIRLTSGINRKIKNQQSLRNISGGFSVSGASFRLYAQSILPPQTAKKPPLTDGFLCMVNLESTLEGLSEILMKIRDGFNALVEIEDIIFFVRGVDIVIVQTEAK